MKLSDSGVKNPAISTVIRSKTTAVSLEILGIWMRFLSKYGVLHYLWRAVAQGGDERDILVQKRKDKRAAMRFFKRLLKGQGTMQLKIVTDKLASYSAAKKELVPSVEHSTVQYENNGCELSHQPTRQQER
ncbi:transposase [Psychromonas sp. SR45-3]|uniref:transposase n=1 Tax=Psychromonas sp. SR45-3 TaxID=2760930 RepID=UPI0021757E90|nr:transposase [Psychromonas sp. SR45-3]